MNEPKPRILLVEDSEDVREQLVAACAENGWLFDEYGDVESATGAIASARSEGREFDAAVFDFYLPRSPRDRETLVDETLCRLVRHSTLVWHISAHFGDVGFGESEVEEHVRTCHSADEQIALIKKQSGFVRKLEKQIKQALAARRIKQSLAMLQSNPRESGYSRGFRRDSSAVSATNLFGRLCGDIRLFWKDLTPAFQNELRESFEINTDDDGAVRSVYPK
jgi:CheY-like chemotaxis protein